MLLRITRPVTGVVDGIDLSQFEAGTVHRLATEIACYLLALDAAMPVDGDTEPVIWPRKKRLFDPTTPPRHARWSGVERRRNKR